MEEVNIYTYTTIKGLKRKAGSCIFLLEIILRGGPKTLSGSIQLEEPATENQAELIALGAALERMRRKCSLTIFTQSEHIKAAWENGWLENWKAAGWTNAKGKPVANMEEWQKVDELLSGHEVKSITGEKHSYTSWMIAQTERKESLSCTQNSENLTQQKKSTSQQ